MVAHTGGRDEGVTWAAPHVALGFLELRAPQEVLHGHVLHQIAGSRDLLLNRLNLLLDGLCFLQRLPMERYFALQARLYAVGFHSQSTQLNLCLKETNIPLFSLFLLSATA